MATFIFLLLVLGEKGGSKEWRRKGSKEWRKDREGRRCRKGGCKGARRVCSTHYGPAFVLDELLACLRLGGPLQCPAVVTTSMGVVVLTRLLAESKLLRSQVGGRDDSDSLL
jgi:hypothetical protein